MLEHIVSFEPGHDCMKFECKFDDPNCVPNRGGSHGASGFSIRFVSKGEEGAVQFLLYTGWMPQYAKISSIGTLDIRKWGNVVDCMPTDLGYHSRKPHYEEQTTVVESCPFCDGEPCYYDGSGLNASLAMYTLVNGGEKALWEFLDAWYIATFRDGEYPKPTEYPMPLRKN